MSLHTLHIVQGLSHQRERLFGKSDPLKYLLLKNEMDGSISVVACFSGLALDFGAIHDRDGQVVHEYYTLGLRGINPVPHAVILTNRS